MKCVPNGALKKKKKAKAFLETRSFALILASFFIPVFSLAVAVMSILGGGGGSKMAAATAVVVAAATMVVAAAMVRAMAAVSMTAPVAQTRS